MVVNIAALLRRSLVFTVVPHNQIILAYGGEPVPESVI